MKRGVVKLPEIRPQTPHQTVMRFPGLGRACGIIALGQLLLLVHPLAGMAQSNIAPASVTPATQAPPGSVPAASNLSGVSEGTAKLQQKVEMLEFQLNSEVKAAAKRFDDAFKLFAVLGLFGSIVVAWLSIMNFVRDRQQHKNYQEERQFYEGQVETRAKREADFASQQLDLGKKVLTHSDEMLAKQIESITKLSGVIGLIQQTFELQVKGAKEQQQLTAQLQIVTDWVNVVNKEFKEKYAAVEKAIFTFKKHSALDWTSLSDEEQKLANVARRTFETIPYFIKNGQDDQYRLALVNHLLGVSALYDNDVDAAAQLLREASRIYSSKDPRAEDVFPRAYTYHFLGLIEKNWRPEDTPPGASLKAARDCLEKASNELKGEKDKFLTPVTLAEVLSYIEGERPAAEKLLNRIIGDLENLKKSKWLDANQRTLLGRAYLLRGNLDFLNGNNNGALTWFDKAAKHNPQNHFAWLSLAQVTLDDQMDEKKKRWQTGLETLVASGALKKRELTVRVIALAWAVFASHQIGDAGRKEQYARDFLAIGSQIRSVSHRVPVFFSPLSKGLMPFKDLEEELAPLIDSLKTPSS